MNNLERYGFLLTAEDREFAQKLSDEFNLPLEELCIDIGMVHGNIESAKEDYDNIKHGNIEVYQDLKDSLSGAIKAVHIVTNNGPVSFSSQDIYFRHFEKAIKNVRNSCDVIIHSEDNPCSKSDLDKILRRTWMGFYLSSASIWNKRVIIGYLLVYFKVDPSIMTKEEFEEDQLRPRKSRSNARDYKHYLADFVKSRMKIYK